MVKTKDIIIVHGRMIMGGVEKALLALLDVLEGKGLSVTLLLLKEGGELYDQIPSWVNLAIVPGYAENEYLIFDNPLHVAKQHIIGGNIIEGIRAALRGIKIRASKKNLWYLHYEALLEKLPSVYRAKVAISFRGLDYFVPYYVLEKIEAEHKLVWIHGDVKHHIFEDNVIAGKLFPRFERIYGVSEDVKKSVDEMFPALRQKTSVFRNLIPEESIKKQAAENKVFDENFTGINIVTVGRLSALKGQDRIPSVVARLKELNIPFRWYLVGNGEMWKQVEDLVRRHEVEDQIILVGNQMNPYPYLSGCDLYVQTSHTEGASVVMHEAKIFHRPIVTTEVASAGLVVTHDVDGLIVPNSEDGLYEGIKEMLQDPEKRKSFERFCLADENRDDEEVNKLVELVKNTANFG